LNVAFFTLTKKIKYDMMKILLILKKGGKIMKKILGVILLITTNLCLWAQSPIEVSPMGLLGRLAIQ